MEDLRPVTAIGVEVESELGQLQDTVPPVIWAAGSGARFAFEEFMFGKLRNRNTRRAYLQAVTQFLWWCEQRSVPLERISPRHVGQYLDGLKRAPASKNLQLSAIRHLFDELVTRHAVILNPAAAVRGEREEIIEGKTSEIVIDDVRLLLRNSDTTTLIGLRDRAIIGILIYTAARVGAVANLKRHNFYTAGERSFLRFTEKGGKSREIPVRPDLREFIDSYVIAGKLSDADKGAPLFCSAAGRSGRLLESGMAAGDIGRMVKRRMGDAGLPKHLSPHSFRVTTITNLLAQGVALEDVQCLAGHADPRTTRLYDRREKRVAADIVDRISI